jgi:hypothetical protein
MTKVAADDVIRINPVDFFSGELRRLEPHLEFASAVCFKIEKSDNIECLPEIEMWCDGERVDIAKYGFRSDGIANEITLVLRRLEIGEAGKVQFRVSVGGSRSFNRVIDKPNSMKLVKAEFGPISIDKPVQLTTKNRSMVVWAIGAGKGVDLTKQDDFEKKLKTLPWAMILRLRLKN